MARKHCTKHLRSPSNYKQRLADRGLNRTPVMQFTGMTTTQIQDAFNRLPHYTWKLEDMIVDGKRVGSRMVRHRI